MMATSNPDSTQRFQELLTAVSQFAQAVATEVARFQPDLVVGLAHSGWLPVLAAQAVWEEQQTRPFPPTLRINFGREKLATYFGLWGDSDVGNNPLDYGEDIFLGHILWWVSQHAGWQTELREMVAQAMPGQTPQRILLVDECIHEGTTYFPVAGLFTTVFPQADVRFVADNLIFWGNTATMAWLHQHYPQTETTLSPYLSKVDNKHWEKSLHLKRALRWVAAGSEDSDADSLVCAPIDQNSRTIARLSPYLAAAEWLQVAPWAHETILNHVRQQARKPEAVLPCSIDRRDGMYWQLTILQRLWQAGALSHRDFLRLSPKPEAETQRWFEGLLQAKEIVPVGWGRATRYLPGPEYQPDVAEKSGPPANAYVVLPGQLWAGQHVLDVLYRQQGLRWLQAQGIQAIVDTTGEQGRLLPEIASFTEATSFEFTVHSVAWQPQVIPSREQLLDVLTWLEEKVDAGQRVYIQSEYGSGRAALVAAACLIRRGLTPQQAWQTLQDRWVQTAWGPYLRLPDSERQRRFLLRLDHVLA